MDTLTILAIVFLSCAMFVAIGYLYYRLVTRGQSTEKLIETVNASVGEETDGPLEVMSTVTLENEARSLFGKNYGKLIYGGGLTSSKEAGYEGVRAFCAEPLLLAELNSAFHKVEPFRTSTKGSSKITFLKAHFIKGGMKPSVAFIGIWSYKVGAEYYYGKTPSITKEFYKYVYNNEFYLTNQIVIFYPNAAEESIKAESLENCIRHSSVKKEMPAPKNGNVYTIKSQWGGYALSPISLQDERWVLSPQELEENYSSMQVTLKNSKYEIPSTNLECLIETVLLKDGTSVGFCGTNGTGKSRLMRHFVQDLSDKYIDDVAFVIASKDVIVQMHKAGGGLDVCFTKGRRYVLVIEEADNLLHGDDASLFKSITDGINVLYKISVMFAFNSERENPMLRGGRVLLFDVSPLTGEQADRVAKRLSEEQKEDRVFDLEAYLTWRKTNTIATLDDIYNFYLDINIINIEKIITEAIEKSAVKKTAHVSPPLKAPISAPVAAPTQVTNTNINKKGNIVPFVSKKNRTR